MQIKISEIKVGERKRQAGDVIELAKSIAAIGLLHPIVITPDKQLIAGLRRLEACKRLGWKFIPATITNLDELQAELAEIDENVIRAELTVLERSEQLARRKEIYETLHPEAKRGAAGAAARWNAMDTVSFASDTAAKTGLSPRTIRRDVQIATKIAPDVRDAIRETPLADSKRDLLDLARLELADQRAVVRVLNKGGAKRVKQAYRKVRQQKVARQAKDAPPLPDRRYRCLVIDPPWPVEKILRDVRPKQQEWDYPTMTVDEIAELPIRSLAEESGCHVYLWVTHRFLPDGLRLFERWGVKYQCLLTWVKNVGITPYSWMYSTEHVLFGRIGSLDLMKVGMRLDFAADRREHSRKPEVFYDIVRQVSPGPRLDMFAREAHDGFEQWGNETNRFSATSAGKLAQ